MRRCGAREGERKREKGGGGGVPVSASRENGRNQGHMFKGFTPLLPFCVLPVSYCIYVAVRKVKEL